MGGAIQIDRKNVLTEDPDTEVPAEVTSLPTFYTECSV